MVSGDRVQRLRQPLQGKTPRDVGHQRTAFDQRVERAHQRRIVAGAVSGGRHVVAIGRGHVDAVRRRIAVIKVAQRTGIPLASIREALSSLPEGRTPTAADWSRLSRRWRVELDARIARLTRLRDDLDGCIGCGCLSLKQCPLRNPDDRMAKLGPGANMLDRD